MLLSIARPVGIISTRCWSKTAESAAWCVQGVPQFHNSLCNEMGYSNERPSTVYVYSMRHD